MFAIGNKHKYDGLELSFTATGSSTILLAVHDLRNEVIKAGKSSEFVGYMRSGVGIPYDIGTKSKRPFSEDVAENVSRALGKKGFRVSVITSSGTETHEQLVLRMKSMNSGMPVILHLSEWHSDSYQGVWYHYNLALQVYDSEGKFLGQHVVSGKESVGTSLWNPVKLAKKKMPPELKRRLEELFNSPEITGILK
jgi:hypothetical protein